MTHLIWSELKNLNKEFLKYLQISFPEKIVPFIGGALFGNMTVVIGSY